MSERMGEFFESTSFDEEPMSDAEATKVMAKNWPDGLYVAIDADCPECDWPERRFDPVTREFSCSRCTYTSKEREA